MCNNQSHFFIWSELINGLYDFEDVTKPPTASLWSGLLPFTHSRGTYSRTVLIQSVLINGMCLFEVSVRKANAEISAELDEMYERLRRVVGYCLAHKAWWHNECTIPIYASAACLPRERWTFL